MKKIFAAMFLALALPVLASAEAQVGVTVRYFNFQGHELPVMIWYPAQVSAGQPLFGYYGQVKGRASFNPAPLNGQHPLVVFSHGLGMCAFQSVFLMEHLAANGYVVAAPDHDDAAMCHIGGGSEISNWQLTKSFLKSQGSLDQSVQELFPDKLAYLLDPAYRPQQIKLVIDKLLPDKQFGQLINPNQIGVMGHSFGGWTAEAVAGAEIDCRNPDSYASSVCEAPDQDPATGANLKKICCQEPYRGQISHFRDNRVKAVLALGSGSFIFPNYEAMDNQVPVMIILGDHFEVDFQKNGYELFKHMNPPIFLVQLRMAGHMTVSDLVYARPGAPLLKQFWRYEAKKQLYQNWSLGFFRRYLEHDKTLFYQNFKQPCWLRFYLAST